MSKKAIKTNAYFGLYDLLFMEKEVSLHNRNMQLYCPETLIVLLNKITELRRDLLQKIKMQVL